MKLGVLAIVLATLSGTSVADSNAKQAHLNRAAKAHEAGNFEVALAELRAAYKLDPDHHLLFALGQVYVQLGRCTEATSHYERFLAQTSDPKAKSVVAQAIAACKPKPAPVEPSPDATPARPTPIETPAPTKAPPRATPEVPAKTRPRPAPAKAARPQKIATVANANETAESKPPVGPPAALPSATQSDRSPWYSDTVGGVLVGGGLLCGVAATVFYLRARGNLDDAEAAPTFQGYQAEIDSARSQRLGAVVLAAGAAMLVTVGVIRYSAARKRSSSHVGIGRTDGGASVTWMGRF